MEYTKIAENMSKGKQSNLFSFLSRKDVIPTDVEQARYTLDYNVKKGGGKVK